jgi:hypothetical protein
VAFYGHTHTLRAEFLDHHNVLLVPVEPHEGPGVDPHPLVMRENQVGWIGVGSVGFPTNNRRMPEYLIFDDERWHIEKYALVYGRDSMKAKTRELLEPTCGKAVAERIAKWL